MKRDIHAEVTKALLQAIEANPGDPALPWHRGGCGDVPTNVVTQQVYRGINVLNLWVTSQMSGYASEVWGTFRQWRSIGAQVRKGETGTPVVLFKQVVREKDDGEEEVLRILKHSNVFNANQVDGWTPPEPLDASTPNRLSEVDDVVQATRATIIEGGTEAYYHPPSDTIHIPDAKRFMGQDAAARTEAFYAVLLHELTHWTGHSTRLDRDLKNRFGSGAYALEELVAEIGAAFLCARLRTSLTPRADHAQYLSHWLKILKDDKKAIFTAAAKAQEAVDFVMQPQSPPA